nr:4'-phosphopantetheinyl transferase superfamily protein [Rhodoferax sp.]
MTHAEKIRLQAIASLNRREQFLAGRWLAKNMLAEAQGGSPSDWCISADGHAKPIVVGHDLQLSISHSGPFLACCIADHAAGIDVERFDQARPVGDMATLVCSGPEQSALRALQGDALTQQFYKLWTCKEARLKQLGSPFDMDALRAIQTEPTEEVDAHVGTLSFLGEQNVMLSLAVEGLPRLHARWPAHWVAGPTQWHRYI